MVSVGGGIALGPVQGTFTYDADTNTVFSYNLFAGNSLFIGPCNAPGAVGAPNPCGTGTDFAYVSQAGTEAIFGAENGNGFYDALILDLSAPLTDAPATISIIPGSCVICSGPGFNNGSSDSGSGLVYEPGGGGTGGIFYPFAGGGVSAPEPSEATFISVAVLFLLGASRSVRQRVKNKAAA